MADLSQYGTIEKPSAVDLSKYGTVDKAQVVPGMERLGGTPPPIAPAPSPISYGDRVLSSLPGSLADLPKKLTESTPGLPHSGPVRRWNPNPHPYGPQDLHEDLEDLEGTLTRVGHFLAHPIDTTKEAFADDPAGTVLHAAQATKVGGTAIKGGVEGALEQTPLSDIGTKLGRMIRGGVDKDDVPTAPASVASGLKYGEYGGIAGAPFGASHIGSALGGVVGSILPVIRGAKNALAESLFKGNEPTPDAPPAAGPVREAAAITRDNIIPTQPAVPNLDAIPAAGLPSGRVPGSLDAAPRPSPEFPLPGRLPVRQDAANQPVDASVSAAAPEVATSPAALSSGRKVGGLHNIPIEQPPITPPEAPPTGSPSTESATVPADTTTAKSAATTPAAVPTPTTSTSDNIGAHLSPEAIKISQKLRAELAKNPPPAEPPTPEETGDTAISRSEAIVRAKALAEQLRLNPPAAPTTVRPTATPVAAISPGDRILSAMKELEPNGSVPVSVKELRAKLPDLNKDDFDLAVRNLHHGQRVIVNRHDDVPNLPPADKKLLVNGKGDGYYNALQRPE